jgi:3'(2'), 5'-bisphosphate nucleotidase
MFNLNTPEIKFALQAARQASLLVRQIEAELVSPALTKDDLSPVTVADYAAQALVGYLLGKSFPADPLIAEEDSAALRQPGAASTLDLVTGFVNRFVTQADSARVCQWIDHGHADGGKEHRSASRFWTLDPIDGTKGFLRGDQYAVALALIEQGQVQVGVLGCPGLSDGYRPELDGQGSLVIAVRGQGAWTTSLAAPENYDRLHVSTRRDPSQARLLRSYETGHTNVSQIDLFARALGVQAEPVLMDSQAKYAVLAAGKGDLLLRLISASKPDYREKIWDQASGSLILEEAGGCITDLDGRPLDFTTGRSLTHNRGILASNEFLHPAALGALRLIAA